MGPFMLKIWKRPKSAEGKSADKGSGYFLAMKYVPRFIALIWATHRGYTVAMIGLRFARAFMPIVIFWVSKLIIDQVVAIRDGVEGGYQRLWQYFLLEFAVVLITELLARASSLVESLLGDLVSIYTSLRLMEHSAVLDLQHFEDPNFYDLLERARRNTSGQIGLISTLVSLGQDALTLFSLASALLVYRPWLLLLLAVAVLPGFFSETRFAALGYSLLYRWTPQRRQLDYLRYLGTSNQTAKELHMFRLARWLIDRYNELATRFFKENKSLALRKGAASGGLALIGTVGYYAAYATILVSAAAGKITLGMLTFLVASFMRGRDLITRLLSGATSIYEQCLYLRDLFDFFEIRPMVASPPNAVQVPRPIRQGFVFENVSFRYPGTDRWAVRNVSFVLRPGERLALVGENGAGKTTLTKLLARLYDPTEGRILLDGRDLREYDLASIREAIGVIFQDFVCYDLHLDENIGVGGIDEVSSYLNEANDIEGHSGEGPDMDTWPAPKIKKKPGRGANSSNGKSPTLPSVPTSITTAAQKSMAAELLSHFPKGYRQMLGRRFSGGVNLSGGEWQKIALARAYMRDAQALILDEPTAALDARAEYEAFNRFSELVSGRMALLISHRFSTVRMADRIIVLKDGKVIESGTHEELVKQDGLYAELFKLQAVGYR
jgi:ATP-binding cassette, subfamily B, bacterial